MISRIGGVDHDLDVIDEIPYLDDIQPQFAYVTEQTPECYGSDEVLTVSVIQKLSPVSYSKSASGYPCSSSDDLLAVKEGSDGADDDTLRPPSQNLSTASEHTEHTETGCSSVEFALSEYVKNAPPDISVDIESSDLKTDACTVIARAESIELLSGSSGTIRSGSTITGYDFDTVKNLNLDSCSTSKLSLSLKSEGFDEFTLTPDEAKVMRNCDLEDFTLTPEASFSEAPVGASTTDDAADIDLNYGDAMRTDSIFESGSKNEDGSISSNEVLVIVDKFLTNERLLQQNLNIIPIPPNSKSFTSPLISPIDSDASSTNALIEKRKSTLFNLQSSSSKSTLDDAIDLEKITFDEEFDDDDTDVGRDKEISTFTTEITKEFDLLFSLAQQNVDDARSSMQASDYTSGTSSNNNNRLGGIAKELSPKFGDPCSAAKDASTTDLMTPSSPSTVVTPIPQPVRIPTRYSMQKLEPYSFADEVAESRGKSKANNVADMSSSVPTSTSANATTPKSGDYCKVLDVHDGSFIQKKIISKLKKNKSQSLGNLNKKTRCFPL